MIYLLDTHYMLWSITDSKKIPRKIKDVITNPDNTIIVSVISFWEVSLKSALGKLEINGSEPEGLPSVCLQMGFNIVQLSAEDASTYNQLKAYYHKDPFDRMLIWQAIRGNYTLISTDRIVKKYVSIGLKVLI